eukprot:COSAG06_NODE_11459_length_1505_cov_3.903983_3_plen_151_part_00
MLNPAGIDLIKNAIRINPRAIQFVPDDLLSGMINADRSFLIEFLNTHVDKYPEILCRFHRPPSNTLRDIIYSKESTHIGMKLEEFSLPSRYVDVMRARQGSEDPYSLDNIYHNISLVTTVSRTPQMSCIYFSVSHLVNHCYKYHQVMLQK